MDILARVPRVLLKQKVELLEALTGFETNNRYKICDPNGYPFAMALETTSCCSRMWCGKERPFTIDIVDHHGQTVIRVERQYTCNLFQCCSCCSICQDCIVVECPPGRVVGFVRQEGTCCTVNFTVQDPSQNTLLYLKGPSYCFCTCPGTVHTFYIMTADKTVELGRLCKNWSGLVKELLTDADNFSIDMPADLAVEAKALLIGAALLIGLHVLRGQPAGEADSISSLTSSP